MSNEQTIADLARQARSAASTSAADPHLVDIALAFERAKDAGVSRATLLGLALGVAAETVAGSDNPKMLAAVAIASLVRELRSIGALR